MIRLLALVLLFNRSVAFELVLLVTFWGVSYDLYDGFHCNNIFSFDLWF